MVISSACWIKIQCKTVITGLISTKQAERGEKTKHRKAHFWLDEGVKPYTQNLLYRKQELKILNYVRGAGLTLPLNKQTFFG